MAGVAVPPDSPVWADVEDPAEVPPIRDDALNSPRGEPVPTDTNFVAVAGGPQVPSSSLPSWATAGGASDSSDSDSDEPDCHICRLTADEMGEPLVVVCACTGLPVHTSCREFVLLPVFLVLRFLRSQWGREG